MFTLRREHQEAFQLREWENFTIEVMEYLREYQPKTKIKLPIGEAVVAQLAEESLREMVIKGVNKAVRYGMTWRGSITAFVVIMFVNAPNFDKDVAIRELLTSSQLSPNLRIDGLWAQTDDSIWERVKSNYDCDEWWSSQ